VFDCHRCDGAFLFESIFSWFYLRNFNVVHAWLLGKGVHTFGRRFWLDGYAAGLYAGIAHRIGEIPTVLVGNPTAVVVLVAPLSAVTLIGTRMAPALCHSLTHTAMTLALSIITR
jgi:hypothetical protein